MNGMAEFRELVLLPDGREETASLNGYLCHIYFS